MRPAIGRGLRARRSPRAGRPRASRRDRLAPAALFLIILGIWYFISLVILDPDRRFLLPSPDAVVRVAFLDGHNLDQLLRALWLSTSVALIGLCVSIALGMVVAIAMSQARWIEKSVYPYAVILQTIPTLAMVPLIGFWFHYGFSSRVIVCVLIALFPVISSTLFGLQSVDQGMLDLFRLHQIPRWRRLVHLQLPAAMPSTFAGFQVSAGLSVVGAVVGDFFFKQGSPGIGVLIDLYRARLQSEQLFGAVILASLLGVAFFTFFGWLSRLVTGRWYGVEIH
ncbi:ABC transporter permease [Frankia sp. AgKG'84/4]|uniref:ABC transporter permease n=1 Tax=Frankia sp. AgKG'84/4 TaxID=573490 RepID=UPI0020108608|nr:ABC transporter permease [Frankia sp. AgKG'84/4]